MATRRNNDTRPAKGSSASTSTETRTGETGATPPTAKRPARARTSTSSRAKRSEATIETRVAISPDERQAMIAKSAYLRAERRGFSPGGEVEDWLAAEKEIDALLSAGHGAPPQ